MQQFAKDIEGPFFLGRQFVASISRLLEKLETRAIAYSNREKKCVAYKENFCVGGPSQNFAWAGYLRAI